MIVRPSKVILESLKSEEGFRSHAYQDHLGWITVGFGRCIHPDVGLGITKAEAELLLVNDITRCLGEAQRAFPWFNHINQSAQTVCVEMVFWIGLTKFRKFKKCLAALEKRDYNSAGDELLNSKLAKQVPGRAERYADRLRGRVAGGRSKVITRSP